MAPRWPGLKSKLDKEKPSSLHSQNQDEEEETDIGRRSWIEDRNDCKSIQKEMEFATSTSLSGEATSYSRQQIPAGFEQFSPPLYQRRAISHCARLEGNSNDDLTIKTGTKLVLIHENQRGSGEEEKDGKANDGFEKDESKESKFENGKDSVEESERRSGQQKSDRDSLSIKEMKQGNDSMAVLSRLPHGGEEAVIYDRRKTINTMLIILGGWCTLILFCFGFKILSIKYQVRAPDILAEWVLSDPTATTQWFTFTGVLLGEIALILWGHSISYMAFRRLAYGKDRTELLTYAAWNEMSRAGYTLSRRRPLWPVFTLLIFIGNTFLPAGFSTLLTPKPMLVKVPYNGVELDQLSDGFGAAIGFLPASTFPNPANLSCGSQYVSNFWTFASHPGTIFDPCPSLDDVQTLIMAGRAKLEDSVNQPEPLFKLPSSITYFGGTGGISTLGVDGILPFSTVSLKSYIYIRTV